MIPQILELITEGYFTLNPVYKGLDMSLKCFQEYVLNILSDKNILNLSFVVIDTSLRRIVGVKIIKDFSLVQNHPNLYGNPKQQFKHNLDCSVMHKYVQKNYPHGVACTQVLMSVDLSLNYQEVVNLIQIMQLQQIKQMYLNGYKKDISALYIKKYFEIITTVAGSIKEKWDIQSLQFNGKYPFLQNQDGAILYVANIDDLILIKNFGENIIKQRRLIEQRSQNPANIRYQKINQNKHELVTPKL
ncbi:hypothetical protein PPERSA_01645 [Pseudocohnilembus persalinus]|uniref:Uncharacterized protein n=1 Tax=Pseudocohnilembus persalinus TaxID=266149 RepID=A0A0V0R5D4_PSEPJ|nr:hypothetical protein PPERSA_01645 [Pseudocohnilembus persalinus]|eukprot:KRX09445.1 hypothetical protein PPERSA_01645 [Pseudocohnilembus persalinus]